jgi:putative membrane protein
MHYSLWGMNLWWWFFWAMLMMVLFALLVPVTRKQFRSNQFRSNEKPLSILERRFAAGEMSTDEYEERRTRLERDIVTPNARETEGRRTDRHQPA